MHFDDPVSEDASHLGVDLHLGFDVVAGAALILQQERKDDNLQILIIEMFADTDTSRPQDYLGNFVKRVDIFNVVDDGELIVAVELVDVLNHFPSRVLAIAMAAQSD
jgi:hypothetical protein